MTGASAAGPIADSAVDDMRALLRRADADLMRLLLRLDTNPGEDSLLRRQAQTSVAVRRQIADRLTLLTDEVDGIVGRRAVEAVEAVVGSPPLSLPLDVRRELDMIVGGATGDVADTFKTAATSMRAAINAGITTGGSLADLVAEVAQALETSFVRATAAVDAAVMGAGRRGVFAAAAASGILDLVYLYVGPRDQKNRPFCRKWVGRCVVDPSTVKAEDGQPEPVTTFCGGYNCRHSWAPITRARALARGYEIVEVQ